MGSGTWYRPTVAPLSALLDIQNLDLARDRLMLRRETLPEREALEQTVARRAPLDEAHAGLAAEREQRRRSEHELGQEVAALSVRIQQAEDTLYSGSVKAPKELEGLQVEIRSLRARQAELEDQEMALLEEIDLVERAMTGNRTEFEESEREAVRLETAIRDAQAEIDTELARLDEQRAPQVALIAEPIMVEYERLRVRPRLAGRAAAALSAGSCGGCRVKLPVMEYSRLKAEPEDALLCCSHCGRLLVR